jgi:hypothetical protein
MESTSSRLITARAPAFKSAFCHHILGNQPANIRRNAPAERFSGKRESSYGKRSGAVALNYRDSSVQQFNLTVQKEIARDNVVSIGYVGVLGRHLSDIPDINAATPNNAANPNALRPYYNQWPDLTYIGVFSTEAVSSYNSLQASVDRRLNHGLVFNVNYNYSQNLSNSGGAGSNGWGTLGSNFSTYEYGNSNLAIRHRIAATGDYMLPFAKALPDSRVLLLRDGSSM